MLAFVVAGLILGVLARALRHADQDPGVLPTLGVGVLGAVLGGVAMNLVLSDGARELTGWSFTSACLVSFALLGLLEGGVVRRRS